MKKLLEFLLVFGGITLLLWGGKNMTQYLTTSLFSAPSGAVDSTSGLVGYWDMNLDGGSTGTVYDLSPNSYNGTNSGATATEGKIGAAMSFDGSNDKVTTTADMIGTGNDSVSAWIYKDGNGEGIQNIIANGRFMFYEYNNKLNLASDASTVASSAVSSIALNTWYHAVVTRTSAGGANFYINGVVSGTADQSSGTPQAGITNIIIGNDEATSRTFDGIIDEVRVYNRVLTTAEITALYQERNKKIIFNAQSDDGLIAHFPLSSDTLVPNEVLAGNGDFESWTSGTPPGWTALTQDGTSTATPENSDAQGGVKSLRLTVDGSDSAAGVYSTTDNFTTGGSYRITLWAKRLTGAGGFYLRTHYADDTGSLTLANSTTAATASWAKYTFNFTATAADNGLIVNRAGGASTITLLDDIRVYDLTKGKVRDLSSSGLMGTITPGASAGFVTDQHNVAGRAYDFDGADTKIDTGSDWIGTQAISVSAWIYLDSYGEGGTDGRFITNASGSSGLIISFVSSNSGRLFLRSDTGTNIFSANGSIPLSQWLHIVITRASGTNGIANFYVNGVLSGTANQSSGTPVAGNTNVIIGNNSVQNSTVDGKISDVRVYNRVLTQAEITALSRSYNPSMRGSSHTKGLVGHWPLTLESEAPGGTDLLSGWNFTSGWTATNVTVNSATQFTTTAPTGYVYKVILTSGKRYKMTVAGTVSTGNFEVHFGDASPSGINYTGTGTFSSTFTGTAAGTAFVFLGSASGAVINITSMTLHEILASDLGVGAKNGTYVAAPEVGSRGTKFNGTSQYIDIGDTAQTAVKTISFWTQADDITSHTDYPIDLNGTDYISIVNGEVTLGGFAGGTNTIYTDSVSAEATIPDVTGWHHVVITSTTGRNALDLDIARLEGTGYHDGKIADVRMWNRALSATEVTQLFKQGRPTSSTDYAANLNGSSQYFTLADSGSAGSAQDFDIVDNEDFMFETWIKTSNISQFGVFGSKRNGTGSASLGWNAYLYNSRFNIELGDGTNGTGTSSSTDLANNTWAHFVGVYDASADQITLYTNGVSRASGTNASMGTIANTSSLTVGSSSDAGTYFSGSVDNVRIYNFGADGLPSNIATLVAQNAASKGKIAPALQSYLVDGWDLNGGGFSLKDARHDLTNTGGTPFVKVR